MSNPTDSTQANDPRSRLAAIVAERGLIADHIEQINAADARLISAASPDAAASPNLPRSTPPRAGRSRSGRAMAAKASRRIQTAPNARNCLSALARHRPVRVLFRAPGAN